MPHDIIMSKAMPFKKRCLTRIELVSIQKTAARSAESAQQEWSLKNLKTALAVLTYRANVDAH